MGGARLGAGAVGGAVRRACAVLSPPRLRRVSGRPVSGAEPVSGDRAGPGSAPGVCPSPLPPALRGAEAGSGAAVGPWRFPRPRSGVGRARGCGGAAPCVGPGRVPLARGGGSCRCSRPLTKRGGSGGVARGPPCPSRLPLFHLPGGTGGRVVGNGGGAVPPSSLLAPGGPGGSVGSLVTGAGRPVQASTRGSCRSTCQGLGLVVPLVPFRGSGAARLGSPSQFLRLSSLICLAGPPGYFPGEAEHPSAAAEPRKEQRPSWSQDLRWDLRDKLFQPLFLFQNQILLGKRGRGYSRVWRRLWRPWPVLSNSLFVHIRTRGEQKRAEQLSDFLPFKSYIFSLQIFFF